MESNSRTKTNETATMSTSAASTLAASEPMELIKTNDSDLWEKIAKLKIKNTAAGHQISRLQWVGKQLAASYVQAKAEQKKVG